MTEAEAELNIVRHDEGNEDGSDNESVVSNEPENSRLFSRLENEIKEEMSSMANQVKETILSLTEQVQQKLNELDTQVQNIQAQLRNQNNNQGAITQIRNSTPVQLNSHTIMTTCATPVTQSALVTETASSSQQAQMINSNNIQSVNSGMETSASASESRADNYLKLKPQHFAGTDDFEDFLTQFEITAELNCWNYRAKSLHLANCLTGAARTLLNELTAEQRRDYKSLVQKLTERYGSENRAEVFRSQLKSRTKGKGETIPELAQAIKKLTRQSYPKVSQDVIEALALDHFIDALTETEIRLRLREVGPKTLAEAEKIAVRMEAHRIADKQRARLVGHVEQGNQNTVTSKESTLEQQMDKFNKSIESIQKSLQNFAQNQNTRRQPYYHNNPNTYNYRNPGGRNFNQRQNQPRGGNPNQYNNRQNQNNHPAHNPRYQIRAQGNGNQSNQGPGQRLM